MAARRYEISLRVLKNIFNTRKFTWYFIGVYIIKSYVWPYVKQWASYLNGVQAVFYNNAFHAIFCLVNAFISTPFNVTVLVAHIKWTRKAFVFFKESSKEGIRRAKDFLNSCRSWTSFKQPTQRVYSTVQKKCKRNSVFFVLCSRENSTKFRHEIQSKRSRIFVESNEISQSSWRNFASTEAKFRFAVISPRNSENSHSRNFARAKIRSCEISTKRNFAGSGGGL